jgi:hypothetical protein
MKHRYIVDAGSFLTLKALLFASILQFSACSILYFLFLILLYKFTIISTIDLFLICILKDPQ